MSAAFTPGPWAVNPLNAQIDAFEAGEPLPICQLLWPTELRSEDTTEANAHLIAAATDLYETLELVANGSFVENGQRFLVGAKVYDILPKIDAALAKARGQ